MGDTDDELLKEETLSNLLLILFGTGIFAGVLARRASGPFKEALGPLASK